MQCVCAQTRPRFILSSERVFCGGGGMELETTLTPREKSPLPEAQRTDPNDCKVGTFAANLPAVVRPVLGMVGPVSADRLVDLVVKAFASRAEDTEFDSRSRRYFSGSSHTILLILLLLLLLHFFLLLLLEGLVGLVVKSSASRAADPRFDSRLHGGDFFESSHASDFKIGTPVATLQSAWRHRVSARTGWPGVSIL